MLIAYEPVTLRLSGHINVSRLEILVRQAKCLRKGFLNELQDKNALALEFSIFFQHNLFTFTSLLGVLQITHTSNMTVVRTNAIS